MERQQGEGLIGFVFRPGPFLRDRIADARQQLARFEEQYDGRVSVYVVNLTGQKLEL